MRYRFSIAAGALAAAALAHGLVYAGVHFDDPLPAAGYYGFCRQILVVLDWAWSTAHGWPPLSRIRDFGWFCAGAIHIACPLTGFLLFRLASRFRMGWAVWKPLAIVAMCAPLDALVYRFLDPAMREPWTEMLLATMVFALMAASVGALDGCTPRLLAPVRRSRP